MPAWPREQHEILVARVRSRPCSKSPAPCAAPPAILKRNRAMVAGLLVKSGVLRLPSARFAIESGEAAVEAAAVDLDLDLDLALAIGEGPLRLRFTNRDEALPAFERPPSFNVV